MGWNKAEFTRLKALITEITEAASREEDPNGFIRIASVNLDWRVNDPSNMVDMAVGGKGSKVMSSEQVSRVQFEIPLAMAPSESCNRDLMERDRFMREDTA